MLPEGEADDRGEGVSQDLSDLLAEGFDILLGFGGLES